MLPKHAAVLSCFRERLPRRKRVTIAIGLRGQDGIVIAADTQESTGNYMKGSRTKMMSFASHQIGQPELGSLAGVCVISGAGDSGYVHALTEELGSTFLNNPDLLTVINPKQASLQEKFSERLRRFYKDHIIPFASFPSRDRPDVEMLIGIYRKFQLSLFVTEKTTLIMAPAYKAIGMGSTFAELLLDKLWELSPVNQLEVLAAYIIFMAKESVESCGKYTQIVTIKGPKMIDSPTGSKLLPPTPPMSHVPWNRIYDWERSFRTVWANTEHQAIWDLIRQTPNPLERFTPKRSISRKSKRAR
jgi:hypothetical protein